MAKSTGGRIIKYFHYNYFSICFYYRCRYRNCCGRVTVLKDLDEMWMKTDHNHTSENELVECGILIAMAKKRAREDETATLDQIVYETVSIVENKEKVLESLPSKAALKQRLKRSRNKSANKTTTSSSPDVIYLD